MVAESQFIFQGGIILLSQVQKRLTSSQLSPKAPLIRMALM